MLKNKTLPGTLAHTSNPNTPEGGDKEDFKYEVKKNTNENKVFPTDWRDSLVFKIHRL